MAKIDQLDQTELVDLVRRTDELGVLSVYVNVDPSEDPHAQASVIDVKNRFRDLQRRMNDEDRREVAEALDGVWSQIEQMAGPVASGRGRFAFLGLGDGWSLEFESQLPVSNRVVLDESPFIHPLIELLDEGRPAGVLVISADDAQVHEWRLGSMEQVQRIDREYVEAPHERTGQMGGGPPGQYHTPMREQQQSREQDRMERFVDQAAGRTAQSAVERRWGRLVVSGGERWTDQAVESLPQQLWDNVVREPRVLSGLDGAALIAAVTELVRTRHKQSEEDLVRRALEAGRSGSGALGLSEVVGALNEGRVDHLIYDPEVRYTGSMTADGMLFAGDEEPPGEVHSRREVRLTDGSWSGRWRAVPGSARSRAPLRAGSRTPEVWLRCCAGDREGPSHCGGTSWRSSRWLRWCL